MTPSGASACCSAHPKNTPITTPNSAPKMAMMTASQRIMRLTCVRLMPTARSRPSSRVRSKIDSPSVFAMPNERDDHRQRQQRRDSPSSWFTNPACCSRNAAWSCTWTLRKSSTQASIVLLDGRRDADTVGDLHEHEDVELLREEPVVGSSETT